MDREMMAQREEREYTNYLRAQRDSPKLQNKEKDIQSRGYQYFAQTSYGRQCIPAHQIPKYDTIHIRKSPYTTITPQERAFLIQREIQRNTIRIKVMKRIERSEEFIQYHREQNKQLSDQLKDIVY